MGAGSDSDREFEQLVADLQRTVEERRRQGQYPPELEKELAEHFDTVIPEASAARRRLSDALAALDRASEFSPERVPYDSSVPLGSAAHRAVGKVVGRQTVGVLIQLREYAAAVRRLVVALIDETTQPAASRASAMEALMDQVSRRARLLGGAPPAEAGSDDGFRPWYTQEAFMRAFRGSEEEISQRYAATADLLAGCSPVVDIGSGRGELMQLLRTRDVEVTGVDLDADLAALARDKGLDVVTADGIDYLAGRDDGSLGGIVAMQVIEHLKPQRLLDLVALASRKLRPDGKLILETVNPQSLFIFAGAYYMDPTHVKPVPYEYLMFVIREAGFADVRVDLRMPVPEQIRLEPMPAQARLPKEVREALDRNVEKVNRLVFGPQDYAVIATR